MAAHVTVTNYGGKVFTVCASCGERTDHGADDRAAADHAARHNAEHHAAA